MPALITTLGRLEQISGFILPHEHIFVDLSPIEKSVSAEATADPAIAMMAPELEKIKKLGAAALVECTPVGVGRRADIVKAVSQAAAFPVLVPTGIYREPWVPAWAHSASMEYLRDWMLSELTGEIIGAGVQAGWIKLSAGDDGLTPVETKIFRAAVQAARQTNAVIGSHTIRGRVVKNQLDLLETAGHSPERFIWIHTQAEPDAFLHLEIARRGAWIEFDGIGYEDDAAYIERILRVLDAGLGHQMMLSHDRGWYDPSKPGGGEARPFDYIPLIFLPKLRAAGVDEQTIIQLTQINPFKAFAR